MKRIYLASFLLILGSCGSLAARTWWQIGVSILVIAPAFGLLYWYERDPDMRIG